MATSIILDDLNNKVRYIESTDYSVATIKDQQRFVRIDDILPFYVKFTAVQIADIRGMIPAIPLQVIGYSNYIL